MEEEEGMEKDKRKWAIMPLPVSRSPKECVNTMQEKCNKYQRKSYEARERKVEFLHW